MIGNQVSSSVANCAEPFLANSGTLKLPGLLLERRQSRNETGKCGRPIDTQSGVPLTLETFLLPSLELQVIDELGAVHDSFDLGDAMPIQLDKPAGIVCNGLIDDCSEVADPGLGEPPAQRPCQSDIGTEQSTFLLSQPDLLLEHGG